MGVIKVNRLQDRPLLTHSLPTLPCNLNHNHKPIRFGNGARVGSSVSKQQRTWILWIPLQSVFGWPRLHEFSSLPISRPCQQLYQHSLTASLFFFYWNIVDLQCCASFRCTAKWISYTYIHFLKRFFTVEFPVLYHRSLAIYFIYSVCLHQSQSQFIPSLNSLFISLEYTQSIGV